MFQDITTTSWRDGIRQLITAMDLEREKGNIIICSDKKLTSSMYKSNPDIKITIICDGDRRIQDVWRIECILRSMLTTWYDRHEELEEGDYFNSWPFITFISKEAFGKVGFESTLHYYKDRLSFLIYKKGLWLF